MRGLVRAATREDIPAIVVLAQRLHSVHPLGRIAAYEAEAITALLQQSVDLETWALFVWEDHAGILGFMVGLMIPVYFNPGVRVASELACYVTDEARGEQGGKALYDAFFLWAQAHGACALQCGVPRGVDHLETFLVHGGFSPLQTLYMRILRPCVPA